MCQAVFEDLKEQRLIWMGHFLLGSLFYYKKTEPDVVVHPGSTQKAEIGSLPGQKKKKKE
jgi:hypothetical protein